MEAFAFVVLKHRLQFFESKTFPLDAIQLIRMQERKALSKNDLNSVTDQRFLLKQWFSISAQFYVFVNIPPNLFIDQWNSTISPPNFQS